MGNAYLSLITGPCLVVSSMTLSQRSKGAADGDIRQLKERCYVEHADVNATFA